MYVYVLSEIHIGDYKFQRFLGTGFYFRFLVILHQELLKKYFKLFHIMVIKKRKKAWLSGYRSAVH